MFNCRQVVAAVCMLGTVSLLASCSGSPDQAALAEVDGALQATAVLLDARVRDNAAAQNVPVARLVDVESRFERLLDRKVVDESTGYSYEDSDGDGLLDGGRLELWNGDGETLCLTFGDSSQVGVFVEGSCGFSAVQHRKGSPKDPEWEAPVTSPGEAVVTVPTTAPNPDDVGTAPSRPTVPAHDGVVERAVDTAAGVEAKAFAVTVTQLARLSGTESRSVALLEEAFASLPAGVDVRWVDVDGVAGDGLVELTRDGGVACIVFGDADLYHVQPGDPCPFSQLD